MAYRSSFITILCLGISTQDGINQTFAMGLALREEGLNTTVEQMADFVLKEYPSKIGLIKTVSAGVVPFRIFTFLIILRITYLPYILQYV